MRNATWSGKWYKLDNLPNEIEADLLVIDGPPQNTAELARYPALPLLHKHLNKNSFIILDDAHRDGEIEIVKRWLIERTNLIKLDADDCEKGCVILQLTTEYNSLH